jgi:aryl-alcohol dehydrogenase-like predicted oxidoreductase
VLPTFEASLAASLERLRLERVDLFILHNHRVTDEESAAGVPGTPRSLFDQAVRPAFEHLVAGGRIGAWGITGIGTPGAVIEVLGGASPPAAVQCVTNVLDSPGSMQRFEGDPRPREIIEAAAGAGVGVMGIRAVQAGALTDAFDRDLPEDHPDVRDFRRAGPFRALAAELGVTPALLAHRYALTMRGVSTVVLGVKNREELRECLAAEAAGPLAPDLVARLGSLPFGA